MKHAKLAAMVVLCAVLTVGCGQKGGLYYGSNDSTPTDSKY